MVTEQSLFYAEDLLTIRSFQTYCLVLSNINTGGQQIGCCSWTFAKDNRESLFHIGVVQEAFKSRRPKIKAHNKFNISTFSWVFAICRKRYQTISI